MVSVSNLGVMPAIVTEIFHISGKCLQGNTESVPCIRLQQLPFTTFPIHCSQQIYHLKLHNLRD